MDGLRELMAWWKGSFKILFLEGRIIERKEREQEWKETSDYIYISWFYIYKYIDTTYICVFVYFLYFVDIVTFEK